MFAVHNAIRDLHLSDKANDGGNLRIIHLGLWRHVAKRPAQ